MRRRMVFIAAVVGISAVILTVGIAVAGGHGGAGLPVLTPAELLARVAEEAPGIAAVSGEIVWANDLLGGAGSALAGADADMASVLFGGSAAVWYQDGKARLEFGGATGEAVVVADGSTVQVYDPQKGVAAEVALPEWADHGAALGAAPPLDAAEMQRRIQEMIEESAPYATTTVATSVVAGRDSYVLVLTPTAQRTMVGSLQVAFDGATFLPLRVQVFAADDPKPVLELGFAAVSYEAVPEEMFEFAPPDGVEMERSTITLPGDLLDGMKGHADRGGDEAPFGPGAVEHESLTLEETAAAAGFALVFPADPTLPFKGGHVLDPAATPFPHGGGGDRAGEVSAPVAILAYGEGMGSVVLVETLVADDMWTELTAGLARVPLFGTPRDFGGQQVYQLATRLGSMVAWRQGDVVVIAGGAVPRADLEAFVAGTVE